MEGAQDGPGPVNQRRSWDHYLSVVAAQRQYIERAGYSGHLEPVGSRASAVCVPKMEATRVDSNGEKRSRTRRADPAAVLAEETTLAEILEFDFARVQPVGATVSCVLSTAVTGISMASHPLHSTRLIQVAARHES